MLIILGANVAFLWLRSSTRSNRTTGAVFFVIIASLLTAPPSELIVEAWRCQVPWMPSPTARRYRLLQGRQRSDAVAPRLLCATTSLAMTTKQTMAAGDYRKAEEEMNGIDPVNYPWLFEGRLLFRPSLVRIPAVSDADFEARSGVGFLSLFGYTLGGTVLLEYEVSPVGPYLECVAMGSLVTSSSASSGRLAVGQWGKKLYVSTKEAAEVCRRAWGVPAEHADIMFIPDDESSDPTCSKRGRDDPSTKVRVRGWDRTRSSKKSSSDAYVVGAVTLPFPILWTPTIKALWVQFFPPTASDASDRDDEQGEASLLPLHMLRLSGTSLRLQWNGDVGGPGGIGIGTAGGTGDNEYLEKGLPMPFGLSVDGLRIEISRADGFV